MARLNERLDSDDGLPELEQLFRNANIQDSRSATTDKTELRTRNLNQQSDPPKCGRILDHDGTIKMQRPLGELKQQNLNSRLLPPTVKDSTHRHTPDHRRFRSSPRKPQTRVDYRKFTPPLSDTSLSTSDDGESFTDLSGFIVPDSASDGELMAPKLPRKRKHRGISRRCSVSGRSFSSAREEFLSGNIDSSGSVDLLSPKKGDPGSEGINRGPSETIDIGSLEGSADGLYLDEPFATLKFSPPRSKSPHKTKAAPYPVTPPSSPSKSQLQSPSKKHRIPPSPHRPSIDAFWSQEVINDWNEQHSPKKALKSPKKSRLLSVEEDGEDFPPSESLRKSPTKSPSKRDKTLTERRRAFDTGKNELATSFLAEVDQTVADGQVAALASSTGGIKIVWSKKLNSTAGRANWRREVVRSKDADRILALDTTHRHHASIELAEKVIDNEDRLINVLAHEYCHLANFMISGVKNNPHGKEFKEWARKCTKAFGRRGVEVTTKHTYEIDYKYVWACVECELEYKRHSKSIDPSKHSCGNCKGKLVQVRPAPRKGQEGKRSEYQIFVKREQARVRLENPGKGFGEVMAILGRDFRERNDTVVVKEAKIVEDSEDSRGDELEGVVRKLDFLDIASA